MILRCLLFILFPNILFAQTATPILNESTKESFPQIAFDDKIIETKINMILQLSHLGHLPNQFERSPFEQTKSANQKGGGVFYKNYELSRSTLPNVLSISFSGILDYRTIRPFYTVDNYDLRTGNKIFIEDILTEKGLKLIHQQNQLDAKQLYQQALTNKEQTLKQVDILQNCLANLSAMPIESLIFQITESGITFSYPECVVSQKIQEQIQIKYTFKDLKSLLTKYAQSLLAENENAIKTNTVKSRLFSGTLGKQEINAFLKNIYPDGSVQILYWYPNRQNQLYEWYGLQKGNQLDLRERQRDKQNNNKPITIALINGSLNKGILSGTWKHIKTGQTLPFKLLMNNKF